MASDRLQRHELAQFAGGWEILLEKHHRTFVLFLCSSTDALFGRCQKEDSGLDGC